jgi:hypothetical protein
MEETMTKKQSVISENNKNTAFVRYDPLGRIIFHFNISPRTMLIATFIVFGVIEFTIIPILRGYFFQRSTPGVLVNTLGILWNNFIVTPIVWSYFTLSLRSITTNEIYSTLYSNQVIPQRYSDLVLGWQEKVAASFSSKKTALVTYILTAFFTITVLYGVTFKVDAWYEPGGTPHKMFATFSTFLLYYIISWLIVREFLTAYWNASFFKQFGSNIAVQSFHPDSAGGLGVIGLYASRLSIVILTLGSGIFFATLVSLYSNVLGSAWSYNLLFVWILYIIMVPFSIGLLIYPSHVAMQNYKKSLLLDLSREIQSEFERRYKNLKKKKKDDDLAYLNRLQDLHTFIEKSIPTWPYGNNIFRRYALTSVAPVLSFAFSLLIDYLK